MDWMKRAIAPSASAVPRKRPATGPPPGDAARWSGGRSLVRTGRRWWLLKAGCFLRRWRRGVAREEEDVEGTREPKDGGPDA